MKMNFTTTELVFMALVGVAFGVLFVFLGSFWQFLNASLGPIGSGALAIFMLPQAIAAYVIRKPGTYLIATIINMTAQLLAGNPAGMVTLAWAFGGIGGELVLAAFKYKRFDMLTMFLAPAANILFNFPITYYFFGWGAVSPLINIVGTTINMAATGIQSGWGGMLLSKALDKAGLLGSFEISKQEVST